MRLGELKNIIDVIRDEKTNKIVVSVETIWNGQGYKINNYNMLVKALLELEKQKWNTPGLDNFNKLIGKYGISESFVAIEASEYNVLNAYINELNQRMPVFYKILDSFIEPQDEYIINIKLPDSNDYTLQKLESTIKQIRIIFQGISEACNIPASFQVVGVASGSKWIEINIDTQLVKKYSIYAIIMGSIGISTAMFNLRKSYYDSETAKLSYEMMDQEYKNNVSFNNHIDKMVQQKKIEDIKTVLDENNITNGDALNKTEKMVDKITEELKTGVEFHPSLNKPKYVNEDDGVIKINYETLREIEQKKNEPKQIENSQESEEQNNAK